MTKARKATQKKTTQSSNRGLKIASALFVILGVLVALSMVVSSIFTVPPQPSAPVQAIPTTTLVP
ncbi:MAG: hypothetical protein BroJett039_00110 [Chloroflexota bacterium]|nr:MAG: hypothetical protein BroJett039_00110 [Chloroflexota bacterium]